MGLVKLCGMTRVSDIHEAAAAGADLVGIVVAYPHSRRSRSVAEAVSLTLQSPLPVVNVLVDPTVELVSTLLAQCVPYAIQLSGNEPVEHLARLIQAHPQVEFWKALHMSTTVATAELCHDLDDEIAALLASAHAYQQVGVTRFVLDARDKHVAGGSGQCVDWMAARCLANELAAPVLLAGGLTPQNVAEAILQVRPSGVDVSSGTETSPGIKSPELIHSFVRAARAAFAAYS
jgi:phosphoribosylanthranilate isomerase